MTPKIPTDKEIAFPHAKINIGLFVTERLSNGYHRLQSLFYPVEWCDALEVIPNDTIGTCRLEAGGITIDGDAESNLAVKAYRRLQNRFPDLPGVDMYLEKRIPFGAGLGGGSSDGAHALLMLRRLFDLPICDEELEKEAAALGADCTFFCRNGAQYLDGVGAELTPHPLSFAGKYIIIVKPPFGVSTREAYSHVVPRRPETPLDNLLLRPADEWRQAVANDFETSVFGLYPALREIKQELYNRGALYASMSGSGSAMFGIFDHEPQGVGSWFPADHAFKVVRARI